MEAVHRRDWFKCPRPTVPSPIPVIETFVRLLPFIAAGAFLPTWTRDSMLLLGTGRPPWNSFAFVSGNASFRMLLGLAALFVFTSSSISRLILGLSKSSGSHPWILVGLAILFGLLALAMVLRKGGRPDADRLPTWLGAMDRFPWYAAFALGFVEVALPGIQYVYFLGAVGVIAASGLGPIREILLLLVVVTSLQAMLVIPVAVYALWPAGSQGIIERVKAWLARNSRAAGAAILAVIAVALAIRAVMLFAHA